MSILVRTKVRRDELDENSLCEIVAIGKRDLHEREDYLNVIVIPLNVDFRRVYGHSARCDFFGESKNHYLSFDNLYSEFDYVDYPYLRTLKEKFGERYDALFYNVKLSDLVFDRNSLNNVSANILTNFYTNDLELENINVSAFSHVDFPLNDYESQNMLSRNIMMYGALSPNKISNNHNDVSYKCSRCGNKITDISSYKVLNGRCVCKDCINELLKSKKIFYCNACRLYHDIRKKYKHNLCKIGYNLEYATCSMCGKEVLRRTARYSPTGNIVCDNCNKNSDFQKYFIRKYHHAPELKFYKDNGTTSCEEDRFKGFGIELEVDEGLENSEKISKKIIEIMNDEVYCMRDGSVPKGIEIISMPHEEKSLYSMNWKRLFYMLKRNKYDSERLGKCGLHIHISKKMFRNKTAMTNMIYFYEKFKKDIILFSRRGRGSIKRWSSFYTGNKTKLKYEDVANIFQLYTTYHVGHSYRYKCVNLQNPNTIEIRIMRGTINYKDFMATLNFIIEIAKKSNTISADKIDDYCEWLKGVNKDTIEYMKKRNCFKKMYERS